MTKKIFDYITPALCGAFSLFLKAKVSPGDGVTSYILPTLGAIALYAFLTLLTSLPKRVSWTRKRWEVADEAVLEGYWIENDIRKDGISYRSIFNIEYDSRSDTYRVSGTAHDVEGKIHADWNSVMVKFDRSTTQLSYTYIGSMPGLPPVQGYAWLKFISTHPVEQGHGYLVDCGDPPVRLNVQLERIPVGMIEALIQRKSLDVKHREEFIRKYHRYMIAQGQAGGHETANEEKH